MECFGHKIWLARCELCNYHMGYWLGQKKANTVVEDHQGGKFYVKCTP